MILAAAVYLCAINLMTFAAFAVDKRAAVRRGWRISERTLLTLALVGGTPAAFAAKFLLRHKTRKYSFRVGLWFIATLQAFAAIVAWTLEK